MPAAAYPGHGADIGVVTFLLEHDLQRGVLAGLDQRCLLPGDSEVVRELALVHDLEGLSGAESRPPA